MIYTILRKLSFKKHITLTENTEGVCPPTPNISPGLLQMSNTNKNKKYQLTNCPKYQLVLVPLCCFYAVFGRCSRGHCGATVGEPLQLFITQLYRVTQVYAVNAVIVYITYNFMTI